MRAVLILAVLMAFAYGVAGAVLLPAYLVTVAARAAIDRSRGVVRPRTAPPTALVIGLVAYACAMAAAAALLLVWGEGEVRALAAWNALAATLTAVVLRNRRSGSRFPD